MKKGMATWQLVLLILVIFFLVAMLIWYSDLQGTLKGLFGQLGNIL